MNPKHMKFCPKCGKELIEDMHGGRMRKACPDKSCGFVHWNNPIPVLCAIVEQEDHLILVQSIGWPDHIYALVTGFMEAGETAEEGVLREVKEEVGLDGKIGSFIGMYPFYRRNQLLLVYHIEVPPGEVKLDESELTDYKRIPVEKVQPWDAGTGIGLRDWLRTKGYERELIPLPKIISPSSSTS